MTRHAAFLLCCSLVACGCSSRSDQPQPQAKLAPAKTAPEQTSPEQAPPKTKPEKDAPTAQNPTGDKSEADADTNSAVKAETIVLLSSTDKVFANVESGDLSQFHKQVDACVSVVLAESDAECYLHVDYTLHPNQHPTVAIRHEGQIDAASARQLVSRIEKLDTLNTQSDPITIRGVYRIGNAKQLPPETHIRGLAITGAQSAILPGDGPQNQAPLLESLSQYARQTNEESRRAGPPKADDLQTSVKELAAARKTAVQLVKSIAKNLAGDKSFPGLTEWTKELVAALDQIAASAPKGKGPEGKGPEGKGPAWDIEKLVTKNPKFWRAYFEVAPGDPALILLHAALLLGAGESNRSLYMARIGLQARQVDPALDQMLLAAIGSNQRLLHAYDEHMQRGITQFDAGKLELAHKTFEAVLAEWPQHGLASYELGYTKFKQAEVKAGRKPLATGKVIVNQKVVLPKETIELYARARFHNPTILHAYQGDDRSNINALLALHRVGLPALKEMEKAKDSRAPARTIMMFAAVMSQCGAHDLALAGACAVVSRRKPLRPYNKSDRDFIQKSLTELIGQKAAAKIVESIASEKLHLRRLVTEPK